MVVNPIRTLSSLSRRRRWGLLTPRHFSATMFFPPFYPQYPSPKICIIRQIFLPLFAMPSNKPQPTMVLL
jgi:hypothetical protein